VVSILEKIKHIIMSQFIWVILLVGFTILNFISAILLKDALKATFRDNKWLKYVFIFPPLAILAWLISFIYLFLDAITRIVTNYFKD
jgi:hypothetical protein